MKATLNLPDEVRRDLASLARIGTPSVRSLRRRYSKALAARSPKIVLRFVRALLDDAGWAERVVSWEVLAAHEGAFGLLNDRLVEEMAHGLSDWGSVDMFGVTNEEARLAPRVKREVLNKLRTGVKTTPSDAECGLTWHAAGGRRPHRGAAAHASR